MDGLSDHEVEPQFLSSPTHAGTRRDRNMTGARPTLGSKPGFCQALTGRAIWQGNLELLPREWKPTSSARGGSFGAPRVRGLAGAATMSLCPPTSLEPDTGRRVRGSGRARRTRGRYAARAPAQTRTIASAVTPTNTSTIPTNCTRPSRSPNSRNADSAAIVANCELRTAAAAGLAWAPVT